MVAINLVERRPQPWLPRRGLASAVATGAASAASPEPTGAPAEAARHGTIPGCGRTPANFGDLGEAVRDLKQVLHAKNAFPAKTRERWNRTEGLSSREELHSLQAFPA